MCQAGRSDQLFEIMLIGQMNDGQKLTVDLIIRRSGCPWLEWFWRSSGLEDWNDLREDEGKETVDREYRHSHIDFGCKGEGYIQGIGDKKLSLEWKK